MSTIKENEWYTKAFLFIVILFIGLFLTQLFASLLMEYLSPGEIKSMAEKTEMIHLVFISWFNFVFCIVVYSVFEFGVDKRKLHLNSFLFYKRSMLQFLFGILAVFLIVAVVLGIFLGTGSVTVEFRKPEQVYLIILMALFSAVAEELIFRDYLLGIFIRKNQKLIGMVLSSLLFALGHVFNPQADALELFTIFLVGLLLAQVTVRLKTIFFAVGFHGAYNFCVSFLGFVPFQDNKHTMLKIEAVSTGSISLGEIDGTSGSVIFCVLLIVFIVLFGVCKKSRI